jgi:hypothetical protein
MGFGGAGGAFLPRIVFGVGLGVGVGVGVWAYDSETALSRNDTTRNSARGARDFVFLWTEVEGIFIWLKFRSSKTPRQQEFLKKSPYRLLGSLGLSGFIKGVATRCTKNTTGMKDGITR